MGYFANLAAMQAVLPEPPDVLFLDIEMRNDNVMSYFEGLAELPLTILGSGNVGTGTTTVPEKPSVAGTARADVNNGSNAAVIGGNANTGGYVQLIRELHGNKHFRFGRTLHAHLHTSE